MTFSNPVPLASTLALATLLVSAPAHAGDTSSAKLARRCDKGQASACYELAERWEFAAVEACEEGAAEVCIGLAESQLRGLGVSDLDRAWWAYERACFLGVDEACHRQAVTRAIRSEPSKPISPLTVLIGPDGLRIHGVKAAMFSSLAADGDEIVIACDHERGCSTGEHFDWDALTSALAQIARSNPSRTQVVLRARGVDFDALLEASRRISGAEEDEPLFPFVVIPEVAQ